MQCAVSEKVGIRIYEHKLATPHTLLSVYRDQEGHNFNRDDNETRKSRPKLDIIQIIQSADISN